jgi:hypothetical protein
MFRAWRDVVNSSARKWPGHGADIVARFRAGDDAWLDWRAERVAPRAREQFLALCEHIEAGDDHGSWALWWWLRNRLFFDLGLDRLAEGLRPLRYEDLVAAPARWLGALCAFAGLPGDGVAAQTVHERSVGKQAARPAAAPIERACDALYEELSAAVERCW